MEIRNFSSDTAVARAAVRDAISTLSAAIDKHSSATWVLAGGSTPSLAYQIIADEYSAVLDWSRVTFLLGDERISPPDSPDNNWNAIDTLVLQHLPHALFIRPRSVGSAEEAAQEYQERIVPIDHFDLVWLGMGDDGHTLSLFPDHSDFDPRDDRLVVPVHNSPKPPADRISLTLRALERAQHTVILATGKNKSDAFHAAQSADSTLPIAQAARVTKAVWLTDIES